MELIGLLNFPKDKIYVLLNKDCRKRLFESSLKILKCKNYFELSLCLNKRLNTKFNGGDIKYWINGERLDKRTGKIHPKFMPLNLILELIKLNKEKIGDIERSIISYRSGGKGLIINKPKVPIKVTPELDSLIIHMFGDGSAGNFTPSYTQKNKNSLNNFIKKLENCFGYFEKSIYFTQEKYQIKFPKAITDILTCYYTIDSYRSHESKIPIKILNRKNKKYKLACIISFIVDEGNIRDVISVCSVNKDLIGGIRQLILDCGYNCSKLQFNKKSNIYLLTMSIKNIEIFYRDIQKLSNKFPTCNLSFKEEQLKFILIRRKIKNPKDRKITEKSILNLLKNNNLTAQQISKQANYAYCTVIHTLERLLKEKRVKRIKIANKMYVWDLI
jgi:hypothetical protein